MLEQRDSELAGVAHLWRCVVGVLPQHVERIRIADGAKRLGALVAHDGVIFAIAQHSGERRKRHGAPNLA